MHPDVRIRDARDEDAPALARLVTELGYAGTAEQVRDRLRAMRDDGGRRRIFVAEDSQRDGRVVGVLVAEVYASLNREGPSARLATIVTAEEVRGRGFGRALVRHFEDWARGQGAKVATLTSANRRAEAHDFYRRGGWQATGLRFARDL